MRCADLVDAFTPAGAQLDDRHPLLQHQDDAAPRAAMTRAIGIDFDNTIVTYDELFAAAAARAGAAPLEPMSSGSTKSARPSPHPARWRDAVAKAPSRGLWPGIGGRVDVRRAGPISGPLPASIGADVYVVSHKTQYGHQDPDRTDLRMAARNWMQGSGLIGSADCCPSVSTASISKTRSPPRSTASRASSSMFSSTISSTCSSSPDFPQRTQSILFAGADGSHPARFRRLASWAEIYSRSSRHERDRIRQLLRDRSRQPPRRTEGDCGHLPPAPAATTGCSASTWPMARGSR